MVIAAGVLSDVPAEVFRLTEQRNKAGDQGTPSRLPTNWRDYLSAIKSSTIPLSFPSVFERNTTHYSVYITTHSAIYTYYHCAIYTTTLCYIHILCAYYTLCCIHILRTVLCATVLYTHANYKLGYIHLPHAVLYTLTIHCSTDILNM